MDCYPWNTHQTIWSGDYGEIRFWRTEKRIDNVEDGRVILDVSITQEKMINPYFLN